MASERHAGRADQPARVSQLRAGALVSACSGSERPAPAPTGAVDAPIGESVVRPAVYGFAAADAGPGRRAGSRPSPPRRRPLRRRPPTRRLRRRSRLCQHRTGARWRRPRRRGTPRRRVFAPRSLARWTRPVPKRWAGHGQSAVAGSQLSGWFASDQPKVSPAPGGTAISGPEGRDDVDRVVGILPFVARTVARRYERCAAGRRSPRRHAPRSAGVGSLRNSWRSRPVEREGLTMWRIRL